MKFGRKKGFFKPQKTYFSNPSRSSSKLSPFGLELTKSSRSIFSLKRSFPYLEGRERDIGKLGRFLFNFGILAVLTVFIFRLFFLTIVQGKTNRNLAESNRIRLIEYEAPRGKILDRNGVVLAESVVTYELKKGETVTNISEKQANDLLNLGVVFQNSEGELGQVLTGIKRVYPQVDAASHIVGFTRKEDDAHLVGVDGLEESYEDFLAGKVGKKLVEVDASGKNVSIMNETKWQAGRNVITTVDSKLQKVAYDSLAKATAKSKKGGAVIVSDVSNGEILALVSFPSFNPGEVSRYIGDEKKPLFNRAIEGTYPPGSVFKIVSALAALENGIADRNTQIEDVGEFKIGDTKFVNWYYLSYGRREGWVNMVRAISRSNDTFFYRMGEKLGLELLRKMAIKLGFGAKTGIDLSDEANGLVPSEQWKQAAFGDSWFLGDTLHLAIGQGFMLVTPIQVNYMTAFAASGNLMKPHLVSEISPGAGGTKVTIEPRISGANLVNQANLDILREGMRQACETGGTAWPFFEAKYKVGCKTGTAEKTLGNPNAWFTAYAPFENPKVAITVLVEEGGEGSSVAAPVAREILDYWMANKR